MKIEELKMSRSQLTGTLEDLVDNLTKEEMIDWIKCIANTTSVGTKKDLLKYWDNTKELKDALIYNEVIEEEE